MRTAIVASAAVALIASAVTVFSLSKKVNLQTGQRTNLTVKRLPEKAITIAETPALPVVERNSHIQKDNLPKNKVVQTIAEKLANTFVYNPSEPANFNCAQGTRVSFSPHTFIDAETREPITGLVDIKVEEYYKMEDIVLNNLSTQSTNGLLETNGMINVKAMYNGRLCDLKEGSFMNVLFPKLNEKQDMQLFTAEKVTGKSMIWNPVSNSPGIIATEGYLIDSAGKNSSLPSYPSGIAGIQRYISSNISFPAFYQKQWEGEMEVEFHITAWSRVENIKVIKELNADATSQVALALSKMRDWKTGFQGYLPSRYKATIKLQFKKWRKEVYVSVKKPFEYAPYKDREKAQRNFYSFTSPKLGWLNCDRFLNLSENTTLYVKTGDHPEATVLLLLTKYRSLVNSIYAGDSHAFIVLPEAEPVTIIAISKEKDGLYLALRNSNTSAAPINDLIYTKVTPDQLKASLTQLEEMFVPTSMR